jgi:hypothetical protein
MVFTLKNPKISGPLLHANHVQKYSFLSKEIIAKKSFNEIIAKKSLQRNHCNQIIAIIAIKSLQRNHYKEIIAIKSLNEIIQ